MRVRGFLAGYLGLIALSALVSPKGSSRFASLTDDATGFIGRLLSSNVPALPDYAGSSSSGGPSTGLTRTAKGPNPDAPRGGSSTILPVQHQLERAGFNKPLP